MPMQKFITGLYTHKGMMDVYEFVGLSSYTVRLNRGPLKLGERGSAEAKQNHQLLAHLIINQGQSIDVESFDPALNQGEFNALMTKLIEALAAQDLNNVIQSQGDNAFMVGKPKEKPIKASALEVVVDGGILRTFEENREDVFELKKPDGSSVRLDFGLAKTPKVILRRLMASPGMPVSAYKEGLCSTSAMASRHIGIIRQAFRDVGIKGQDVVQTVYGRGQHKLVGDPLPSSP